MGPTFVTTRRPPTSKVTTQAEPTFAPTAGARSGDHTQRHHRRLTTHPSRTTPPPPPGVEPGAPGQTAGPPPCPQPDITHRTHHEDQHRLTPAHRTALSPWHCT